MKVIIQRVSSASCKVNDEIISSIDNGLLLLVGISQEDTVESVNYIAKKVANMRIFEDDKGLMNLSILDKGFEILSISQFTIYGSTKKGNRPSFTRAAKPDQAKSLYLELSRVLNEDYKIKTYNGIFKEYMDIELINDGPVTLILESK